MRKYLFIILLAIFTSSCEQSIQYRFQENARVINCDQEDNALLNEALYSFENDIATYYMNTIEDIRQLDVRLAYAHYIQKGALGTNDYQNIASKHSIKILKQLKEKGYIINTPPQKSNLNYTNNLMSCIVDKIEDKVIQKSLQSQIEVDYLHPKRMANTYSKKISDAYSDKYFAFFLALDTYYQYLADIDFSKSNKDG